MKVYHIPDGYPSFEAVETIFRNNLPEGFKITKVSAGGKMPMFTTGKMVGTIIIRQNSYNGAQITFTSTDGKLNDNITVVDIVPSWIVQLLRTKVLGLLTNLIFPAIYGTSKKVYTAVDDIIMKNMGANEMDTGFGTTLKNMVKGRPMTDIKRSSSK